VIPAHPILARIIAHASMTSYLSPVQASRGSLENSATYRTVPIARKEAVIRHIAQALFAMAAIVTRQIRLTPCAVTIALKTIPPTLSVPALAVNNVILISHCAWGETVLNATQKSQSALLAIVIRLVRTILSVLVLVRAVLGMSSLTL